MLVNIRGFNASKCVCVCTVYFCVSAHLGSIEKETVYDPYSSLESENFIFFQTKLSNA